MGRVIGWHRTDPGGSAGNPALATTVTSRSSGPGGYHVRTEMADLHLVSLDPAFEGLVWPSKIYGIEAAGRPWIRLRPGLEVEDLREAARRSPRPRSDRPGLEAWVELLGAATTPARLAAALEA